MHLPEQYTDMHGGALTESADIEWQALLSGTNELARYLLEEYGIKLVFHPHADTHVDTMNVAASSTLARSRCARLIRPSTATTITEVRAVSKDRDALRGHGSPIATKSPSSCCGSWPAGCAAPTATWTPLVVGAARVSFVRAAPGPGGHSARGLWGGSSHRRSSPSETVAADNKLCRRRPSTPGRRPGTEPSARWQDAQPANVFG